MADAALLLDTHAWLRLAHGEPARIRRATARAIEDAGAQRTLCVSAISVWEIALLESKGRLVLPMGAGEWIRRALERVEFELVGLEPEIAVESCRLPGSFHADPADRFLVATARIKKLTLVTRDARILKYARQGHLQAMTC